MEIRTATPDDVAAIRRVARASIEASYGHVLDDDLLDGAVETWYETADVERDLADDDALFVVADDDGELVGFVESYVTERREPIGEIDWLHVDPDDRERGIGTNLLRTTEAELLSRGVERIEGRVLAANEAGTAFYEREGFSEAGEREVVIGDEPFVERFYSKFPDTDAGGATDHRTTDDGDTYYVAYDEHERGSHAPFYVTYSDSDRDDRLGFLCGGCDAPVETMDAMGRLECGDCGNRRKPTRWDAAYL